MLLELDYIAIRTLLLKTRYQPVGLNLSFSHNNYMKTNHELDPLINQ